VSHRYDRAGHHLADAAEYRMRRGYVVVTEVEREGAAVYLQSRPRAAPDGLQLGAECQPAAVRGVVERLLAEPVARKREAALFAIPEGHGEHAVQAPDGREHAPLLDCRQQHFRVGTAAERMSE